ncbi:HNH endonuclease [Candidatus Pacearchaeota archaeon]|jgi:5-methylcytosine-specific restriction endonuclease McrA|nr:HNH endonuclease [Candidatus Pacearchaeota archaeon]
MKPKDRLVIKNKYNGHCAYCGIKLGSRFHIDHIFPRSNACYLKSPTMREIFNLDTINLSDVDDVANLNPSCERCNRWKQTYSIEQFRKEIELQVERLRRTQAGFRLAEDFGIIQERNTAVVFYFEYPEFKDLQ